MRRPNSTISDTDAQPVVPAPAASVLLLRDGDAGVEVFMTLRSPRLSFSRGALVFPGGKVDPADADPASMEWTTGPDDADTVERAARLAAVRETFEEVQTLLAVDGESGGPVDADRARAIAERHRVAVHGLEREAAAVARMEGIRYDTGGLASFARWITPARNPRRFDVRFYLAKLPEGVDPVHDGVEAVDSLWIGAGEALAAAEEGDLPLMFPTRAILSKLAPAGSVADAFRIAAEWPVHAVETRFETRDGRSWMSIPGGMGYTLTELAER